MEFPEVIALIETYGTGGALVAIVGYLAYHAVPALKSLKVNPSLGEHLGAIQARLLTIESAVKNTARRTEDIWEAQQRGKKSK